MLLLALPACKIERATSGRLPGPPTEADSLARVELDSALSAQVRFALAAYYRRFSSRDWGAFRQGFWPGAVVTTRWTPPGESRPRVTIQSVDEFIRRASEGPGGRAVIFNERPVHTHVQGYGDLADAWVVYEGRWGRTRDSLTSFRGVDAFHLYRHAGEWRIASLTFTPELPGRPITP